MKLKTRNATAVIGVRVGAEFDQDVSLRRNLTRIGSHPSCELRLSDAYAPPYLVTVEQKNGEVWLHNRSGQVMRVGEDDLPSESSRRWRTGEAARLNAWVSIHLKGASGLAIQATAGTNARTQPSASGRGPSHAPTTLSDDDRMPGQKAASLVLTGILLLVLAWLLLHDASDGSSPSADQLARLVQQAHGEGSLQSRQRSSPKVDLCLRIQDARIAEIRGSQGHSRQVYSRVRDELLARRQHDGSFRDPWFDEAFTFVRDRLGEL